MPWTGCKGPALPICVPPETLIQLFQRRRESSFFFSSLQDWVSLLIAANANTVLPLLLEIFLEDPTDFQRTPLLDGIRYFGDPQTADLLMAHCLNQEGLNPDVLPDVLHCIGSLGHEQAEPRLFRILQDSDNWHVQKAACLGLLNCRCAELHSVLEKEIRKCLNQGLFKEFVPALVCKLPEPDHLLKALYWSGRNVASVDCSGGIILGFGLSGAAGRYWLERVIQESHLWQLTSSGTGLGAWFWLSTRYAGLRIAPLFQDLLQLAVDQPASAELESRLQMLRLLLNHAGSYPQPLPVYQPFCLPENPLALYQTLFNGPVSLHSLVSQSDSEDTDWSLELETCLLAALHSDLTVIESAPAADRTISQMEEVRSDDSASAKNS